MGWTRSGGRSQPRRDARSHIAENSFCQHHAGKELTWAGLSGSGARHVCLRGAGVHSLGGGVAHRSWVLRASWSRSAALGFVLNLTRNPRGALAKESPDLYFHKEPVAALWMVGLWGGEGSRVCVRRLLRPGRWSGGGLGGGEQGQVGGLPRCLGWGVQRDAWADGRGWRKQRAWQCAQTRVSF